MKSEKVSFKSLIELAHNKRTLIEMDGGEPPVLCVSGATLRPYSFFNQCLLAAQYGNEEPEGIAIEIPKIGKVLAAPLYTFNQIKQHGWKVKKGSKSMVVVYAGDDPAGSVKITKADDGQEEIEIEKKETAWTPKSFRVFKLQDIDQKTA